MQQRIRELERGASTTGHRQDAIDVEQIIQTAKAVGPVQLIRHNAKDVALPMLRSLADKIRGKSKKSVIALFSEKDAKVNLIIALTRDLNNSPIDAKVLAQKIAPLVDGSAGGRKDLAQGGGRRTNGIPTAIDALPKLISDAEGQ
jgi:alanyl-tRNA synthetase